MAEDSKEVLRLISSREWKLEELIAEGQNKGLREEKLARELHSLWDDGKVLFAEAEPPKTFKEYLLGARGLWFFGILVFLLAASLLIYALPAIEVISYLRYLVGSILILYVPGYVAVEALYSGKSELDDLERLVLSIGLSLVVVPLLALLLAYTPWGVSLDSIFLLLSAFTVAFGLFAARRRFDHLRGGSAL